MIKEFDNLMEKNNELLLQLDDENNTIKNGGEYTAVFLGVIVELISSKKLFKKNSDVADFLNKKFGIVFAEYCKKSRPLMIGKTVKHFLAKDEHGDIKEYLNELYAFIVNVINGKQNQLTWSDVIKSIKL